MADDIRKTEQGGGPKTDGGGGAPLRTGYGAGGLGAGGDRAHHGQGEIPPNTWDAPGVTPDGRRTGSATEGPRMPVDGESGPDGG
ncbi:MAG: hypothetical protein KGO51_03340 [Alphaproteobacteria bacterium]|nr:hypothetical protein [Alphaproteobacteria bacterium]